MEVIIYTEGHGLHGGHQVSTTKKLNNVKEAIVAIEGTRDYLLQKREQDIMTDFDKGSLKTMNRIIKVLQEAVA
jgi:hypothetical protein